MTLRMLPRTARAKGQPITLAIPTDGRGFAALRLALSISQWALAKELGWHASTLAHREASAEPLSDDKRAYWLAALRRAATHQYDALHHDLRKVGLHISDLPGAGLGALLTALQASAPSGLGGDAA